MSSETPKSAGVFHVGPRSPRGSVQVNTFSPFGVSNPQYTTSNSNGSGTPTQATSPTSSLPGSPRASVLTRLASVRTNSPLPPTPGTITSGVVVGGSPVSSLSRSGEGGPVPPARNSKIVSGNTIGIAGGSAAAAAAAVSGNKGKERDNMDMDDDDFKPTKKVPAAPMQFVTARETFEENYEGPSILGDRFDLSTTSKAVPPKQGNSKAKKFEDLLGSSETVKLSSTPDYLKSIEVKKGAKVKYEAKEPKYAKEENKLAEFFRSTAPPGDPTTAAPNLPPRPPLKSALAKKSAVEEKTAAVRAASSTTGSTSSPPSAITIPSSSTFAPTAPKSAPVDADAITVVSSISTPPLPNTGPKSAPLTATKPNPPTPKPTPPAPVDDSDSDIDDYFHPNPNKKKKKEKEMSLAEFLKNSEPPGPPQPPPRKQNEKKSTGLGFFASLSGRSKPTSESDLSPTSKGTFGSTSLMSSSSALKNKSISE
ncbi:hypothetical protein HDV05_005686, partial [Chytridiales sp. JEL 0842]